MVLKYWKWIVWSNCLLIIPIKDYIRFICWRFLSWRKRSLGGRGFKASLGKLSFRIILGFWSCWIMINWVFLICWMSNVPLLHLISPLLSPKYASIIKNIRNFHHPISTWSPLSSSSGTLLKMSNTVCWVSETKTEIFSVNK